MSRAMLGVRPEVVEDVAVRALPRRPLAWPMRVVVVSAMGDTTDELLAMARELAPSPSRREPSFMRTYSMRSRLSV